MKYAQMPNQRQNSIPGHSDKRPASSRREPFIYQVILIAFVASLLFSCEQQPQIVEQQFLQFGTVIDITLIHDDLSISEQVLVEIEQQLSAYQQNWHAWEDGDLSRFNLALSTLQPVEIPASLRELIDLSQQYYLTSNQLFNPALGKLIAAYGFHGQSEPDEVTISAIRLDLPKMPDLEVKKHLAINHNTHLQLDFGGIAKGYAIGLIARYLDQQGFEDYLINAGGDILTSGSKFGEPWHIGVQNPFEPGAIAGINLRGKHALFTSGNYRRFYLKGDKIVHHIIDPRSGKPSEHISSATVMVSDPVLADVAATTLMIDGLNSHQSLAGLLGIEDYMIIGEDRSISISRSLAEKIELAPGLRASIIE